MDRMDRARRFWTAALEVRGAPAQTSTQIADLLAGTPEIAYSDPESAEEIEPLLATVDVVIRTLDLEELGVANPTQARLALIFALWQVLVQNADLFETDDQGPPRLDASLPFITATSEDHAPS